MRSSIRVRKLCACNAYWARSFRARSVTENNLVGVSDLNEEVHTF